MKMVKDTKKHNYSNAQNQTEQGLLQKTFGWSMYMMQSVMLTTTVFIGESSMPATFVT